jgi:hypothetical protein
MRSWTSIAGLALAGVAAGVAAKAADESTIHWASDLGTYPAVWILVIALIGRFAPTGGWAAARGVAFFVAMTLSYYAWSVFVLGFGIDRWLSIWAVLAVTAVPLLAVAVWWASRETGIHRAAVMAGMAGIALADGTVHRLWLMLLGDLPAGFPVRPFQALFNVLAALVIAGCLPVHRRARAWALGLTPVMAILAGMVIDEVLGRVLF